MQHWPGSPGGSPPSGHGAGVNRRPGVARVSVVGAVLQQPSVVRRQGDLHAVVEVELGEDAGDAGLDGGHAHEQFGGDPGVGESAADGDGDGDLADRCGPFQQVRGAVGEFKSRHPGERYHVTPRFPEMETGA